MSNMNGLTKVVVPQSSGISGGASANIKSYKSAIQNAVPKNLGMKTVCCDVCKPANKNKGNK